MPEYSSTTITPADAVKVPAMNGSTSGNFQLDALRNFVLASKGQANGLASLGSDGKLTLSQLPDLADDVLVYGSYALLPNPGVEDKLYITADTNIMYRWDSGTSAYVILTVDLSDYETKAEANDLKNAIDKNTAEIQNLIQKAGDYVPYKYPNDPNHSAYMPNLVPPSMAKNALVESIRGKSRGWNQLAKAMNATNWEFGGSTGSFSDGTATFTASGQYGCVRIFGGAKFNLFANHYYLISAEIKTTSATTSVKLALSWNVGVGESAVAVASSTSWQTVSFIVPFGATGYNDGFVQVFDARNGSWDAVQVRNAICRDITIIFPEGVPATVAECVKACPDILKNNAYDAGSLVDTVVSGVESRGFNLWDEEWESGTIWGSGAESSANAIRSADYQQIAPLTTVYGKIPSGHTLFIAYYDENKTFIDRDSITNTTFTLPASAKFFKITTEDGYGTTYNHDICVNISSSLNGTYKPYVAPQTLSLSTPVTLRSAGSVYEELDVESGEVTHPLRQVNLGSLTWMYETWDGLPNFYTTSIKDIIKRVAPTTLPNLTSDMFPIVIFNDNQAGTNLGLSVSGSGNLDCRITNGYTDATSFTSWVNNHYINIELATADANTNIGATTNCMIQTEGGGTINTIQTQTPVIDNCLDVAYLAL